MKPEETKLTRRRVLGSIGTGIVAALTTSAFGQQDATGGQATGGEVAQQVFPPDYPEPPFPRQQQEWPGLTGRMEPVPDHGEESYQGTGRLVGRKALITGGDSGIGRAAAIAYAREGADVAINYLPAEEPDAQEVVTLIEEAGQRAAPIPGDIRDEAFCRELVNTAVRELGGLDVLVNNAAYQKWERSILDISTEQFDRTLKTNVYAPFWITKAALEHLSEGASIITTSSVVAFNPVEILFDYSQTKAALVAFTQSLAKQLAGQGIRVNAVAPGPFWTPLQVTTGQPVSNLPSFGSSTPLGRPGQPVELAPIYVMLASADATSYITGQVFGASGGTGVPG